MSQRMKPSETRKRDMFIDRIPSLRALQAFVATAKHLSFTRGAQTLNLTQSAVSLQVKGLEEFLGVRLFHRKNEGLALSAAGSIYLALIEPTLQQLATATMQLHDLSHSPEASLKLSVFESFATRWLIPRLNDFLIRNSSVNLEIEAENTVVDLEAGEADIAIRYGSGCWTDVNTSMLFTDVLYPICKPELAKDLNIKSATDLLNAPLLADETCHHRADGWKLWFNAANLMEAKPQYRCIFNNSGLLIQAVLEGQGVGLGRHSLIFDEISRGKLTKLTNISLENTFAYYLCSPKFRQGHPKTKIFADWVFEKSRETPPVAERLG